MLTNNLNKRKTLGQDFWIRPHSIGSWVLRSRPRSDVKFDTTRPHGVSGPAFQTLTLCQIGPDGKTGMFVQTRVVSRGGPELDTNSQIQNTTRAQPDKVPTRVNLTAQKKEKKRAPWSCFHLHTALHKRVGNKGKHVLRTKFVWRWLILFAKKVGKQD